MNFLTTEQVAAMLCVSKATVLRLVRAKKIPAFKLSEGGRCYRFKEEDVIKHLIPVGGSHHEAH